ncbi:MAG: glycosyltransferase family 2 protein [Roseivivax sp.]|nr:glycosyltransferase family 2 protein [Roseivivax sp.]
MTSRLGVIVVTFNSAEIILDCLESLLAAHGTALSIAVVDNASGDATVPLIQAWARGETPYAPPADLPFALTPCARPVPLDGSAHAATGHRIALIELDTNTGFAGGVNAGLAHLAADPEIDRFWVLNPDTVTPPETPAAFAGAPVPDAGFSLMGGRVLYYNTPEIIQIDGGTINRKTGVTGNLGLGRRHDQTPPSRPEDMDFITGASMVVSRAFYEAAGPMPEDYFLYYEEVDWAMRRGDLPFAYCPGGIVYHRAGTAIGSPTLDRPASPFSQYFKHRGRLMFIRRHLPGSLLTAQLYTLAKAAQLALKGYRREAMALVAGSLNRPAPREVTDRLPPEVCRRALGLAS